MSNKPVTPEEQARQLAGLTTEELEKAASNLSAATAEVLLPLLDRTRTPLVWNAIDRVEVLEAAAHHLSSNQVNAIVRSQPPTLAPLWVGLPVEIFDRFLTGISDNELKLLQSEAEYEPMQALLHKLADRFSSAAHELEQQVERLAKEIETIDLTRLSSDQLESLTRRLNIVRTAAQEGAHALDKALSIAWASNRPDLVDLYTTIKQRFHHLAVQGVGYPTNGPEAACGLYDQLEMRLEQPYRTEAGSDNGFLSNDAPVAEAMGRLAVWYLKDFYEVGLLPNLTEEEAAQLPKTPPPDGSDKRAFLHEQALANLRQIGLQNVGDCRRHKIYSRPMLQEYVQKHL